MTDRRLYAEDEVTLLNEDPGDTTPLFVDGSYGDVEFPALAIAAEGFTLTSGAADITFLFSESADGFTTLVGAGDVSFAFSEAANGTVGDGGDVVVRTYRHALGYLKPTPPPKPEPIPRQVEVGDGEVTFAFGLAARGTTNDDDLAILLAA